MTLAEKIAAALRSMMSEPGMGYIDFTWRVGTNLRGEPYGPSASEEADLIDLAESIAEHWPTDDFERARHAALVAAARRVIEEVRVAADYEVSDPVIEVTAALGAALDGEPSEP